MRAGLRADCRERHCWRGCEGSAGCGKARGIGHREGIGWNAYLATATDEFSLHANLRNILCGKGFAWRKMSCATEKII